MWRYSYAWASRSHPQFQVAAATAEQLEAGSIAAAGGGHWAGRRSQAGMAIEPPVLEPQRCDVVAAPLLRVAQHAVRLAEQLEDGISRLGAQPSRAGCLVGVEHLRGRKGGGSIGG